MRKIWQEATIADAIAEAYEVISELADQMREAFEALPEVLKASHSRREDGADWLEIASDELCGLVPEKMREISGNVHMRTRTDVPRGVL